MATAVNGNWSYLISELNNYYPSTKELDLKDGRDDVLFAGLGIKKSILLVFDKFVTRIHIDYVDSEEKYNNFIESPLFNNLSNRLADLGWSIVPEWNTSKNKMILDCTYYS